MSNERVTLYTCDRCGKKDPARSGGGYEDDSLPMDWGTVKYANPSGDKIWDLCGACSAIVRELLGRFLRKEL